MRVQTGAMAIVGAVVLVCLAAPGCDVDGSRRVVEDVEGFRADGCGANRHKNTQTQTCEFTGKPDNYRPMKFDGECAPNDTSHILCTYEAAGSCQWSGEQTAGTCRSDGPGIAELCVPPANAPKMSKTYTLGLPNGNVLCDPKGKDADLDEYCKTHPPATLFDDLTTVCTDKRLSVTKTIACCVDDAPDDDDGGGLGSDDAGISSDEDAGELGGEWLPDAG